MWGSGCRLTGSLSSQGYSVELKGVGLWWQTDRFLVVNG